MGGNWALEADEASDVVEAAEVNEAGAQYTNQTVMRIWGLNLNSTIFFPLLESADVMDQPNSSH